MKVYVDIGPYWQDGLSVNSVYEDLLRQDKKIDQRTLRAAREGRLSKCEFVTLLRLRDLASQLAGRSLKIDDLFRIED